MPCLLRWQLGLSYGYTYTNLNTSDLADEVAGLVSNIKEDSEAKPGYERVKSNASDPLNVAKEIGEVAAVRRETKSMPGLIHFAGHGAYIRWPERVVLFDNTIEFPRADRCGHKWLGIVTEGYARMIHNVESIREYTKGVEKPLKNVRVVLLFGCITGPDLPQKFFDLGTQAAVGTNKIMWFGYHKLFVTVFWRSLALGLCVHDAINKGVNSVNNELKRKGEYYYITYRLWSTYFVVKGDPTTLIIY